MKGVKLLRLAAMATLLTAGLRGQQAAQLHSDDCAGCHDSGPRAGKRQAGVPPGFNSPALKASPHASLECVACHSDIKEVPHPEKLAPVDCGLCHAMSSASIAAASMGRRRRRMTPMLPMQILPYRHVAA
jgi:hypothetical protein